jgi:hypothetical protein
MENALSMKSMIKKNTSNCSPNILESLFQVELGNMESKVKTIINDKFLCSQKFAQDIEYIVKISKTSYIDAIIEYCEQNNIEIETVPKLISKPLKEKIKCEATKLNFLKKTSRAILNI